VPISPPRIVVVLIALMPASFVQAQPRAEVAIKAVTLDNGAVLYSIPIKVGSTLIEAGLDTGSPGLRVLPGTLAEADAKNERPTDPANFSSGVRYEGRLATGTLTVGSATGISDFEKVESIACMRDRPDCPARTMSPTDYGVGGNSLTAGRFRAIFGINTGDAPIPNPLLALGVKRWIVELPRPGETGRLILNPTDVEAESFTFVPNMTALRDRGGLKDAVDGCLVEAETKSRGCGAMVLDSGAPSIRLHNVPIDASLLADGKGAAFVFLDANGPRAIENIVLGQAGLGTYTRIDRSKPNIPILFAGSAPYMGLSVLYDPDHNQIGLKSRPPVPMVPAAEIVSRK
jgi:hypothetical protein